MWSVPGGAAEVFLLDGSGVAGRVGEGQRQRGYDEASVSSECRHCRLPARGRILRRPSVQRVYQGVAVQRTLALGRSRLPVNPPIEPPARSHGQLRETSRPGGCETWQVRHGSRRSEVGGVDRGCPLACIALRDRGASRSSTRTFTRRAPSGNALDRLPRDAPIPSLAGSRVNNVLGKHI